MDWCYFLHHRSTSGGAAVPERIRNSWIVSTMEPAEKLEMVHQALQQLMEERKQRRKNATAHRDEEEGHLLAKLLSQLDSLDTMDVMARGFPRDLAAKQEEEEEASAVSSRTEAEEDGTKEMNRRDDDDDDDDDELVKELRRIRKQNLITHCLLSALILVTAAWQFSEVSLVLAVRDKLRHPLRAVGDLVKGAIKGNKENLLPEIEAPPLPPISVPEMPLLTSNNAADDD